MLFFYLSLIDNQEDKSKFEILYYEYRERMFSVSFEILKNKEDAEDAVHNAFIGIANNMKSIGEVESNRTLSYCIKAAKNAAINIFNKKNKIKTVEYSDNLKIEDEDFFEKVFAKDSYEKVVNAIMSLSDTYKIPLYYHYVENMKIKELASLLDISQSAVKVRLHRGKKELLEILGENINDK